VGGGRPYLFPSNNSSWFVLHSPLLISTPKIFFLKFLFSQPSHSAFSSSQIFSLCIIVIPLLLTLQSLSFLCFSLCIIVIPLLLTLQSSSFLCFSHCILVIPLLLTLHSRHPSASHFAFSLSICF
jgi:hypothetical protein